MHSIHLLMQVSGMSHFSSSLRLQHSRGRLHNHHSNDNLNWCQILCTHPCLDHPRIWLVRIYGHVYNPDLWYNSLLESFFQDVMYWMLTKSVFLKALASCNPRNMAPREMDPHLWRFYNWFILCFRFLLTLFHFCINANKGKLKLSCMVLSIAVFAKYWPIWTLRHMCFLVILDLARQCNRTLHSLRCRYLSELVHLAA